MQHALLVIRVNIGQQTLVRLLKTEPVQLAQHVLRVNKKPEVALDLLTLLVQLVRNVRLPNILSENVSQLRTQFVRIVLDV